MARTKAMLGAGAWLSDYLSAILLARVYPPELMRAVLDEHGVNSQRIRSFPAIAAGYYYCIALSLYPVNTYGRATAMIRPNSSPGLLGRARRPPAPWPPLSSGCASPPFQSR